MKSLILNIILPILISSVLIIQGHAATAWDNTGSWVNRETSGIPTRTSLLIEKIDPIDSHHISIHFNQPIIQESVRLRITKQSDESNVRIESYTGSVNKNSIQISLSEWIIANTAYKLTVISAISEEGTLIKDGADGIKEFTTTENLKKWIMEFNAPSNPNAIQLVSSENTKGTWSNQPSVTIEQSNSWTNNREISSEKPKELPLSWVNTTFLVLLAWSVAWIFLAKKKRI